jgi:hypothetical protein
MELWFYFYDYCNFPYLLLSSKVKVISREQTIGKTSPKPRYRFCRQPTQVFSTRGGPIKNAPRISAHDALASNQSTTNRTNEARNSFDPPARVPPAARAAGFIIQAEGPIEGAKGYLHTDTRYMDF